MLYPAEFSRCSADDRLSGIPHVCYPIRQLYRYKNEANQAEREGDYGKAIEIFDTAIQIEKQKRQEQTFSFAGIEDDDATGTIAWMLEMIMPAALVFSGPSAPSASQVGPSASSTPRV